MNGDRRHRDVASALWVPPERTVRERIGDGAWTMVCAVVYVVAVTALGVSTYIGVLCTLDTIGWRP